MEDEALECGVVLRTGMRPGVAVGRDEIAAVLWLGVVKLVTCL